MPGTREAESVEKSISEAFPTTNGGGIFGPFQWSSREVKCAQTPDLLSILPSKIDSHWSIGT